MELQDRLAAYARRRLDAAAAVTVGGLQRIHGGASRETFRFVLRYRQAGREVERRLILRRDPAGSLIETDRAVEFAAYAAFHGTAVPVPEPLWLEEDAHHLDHPFFIMEELVGGEAVLPGHRGDGLADPAPVDREERVDEVVDAQRGLAHHGAHQR